MLCKFILAVKVDDMRTTALRQIVTGLDTDKDVKNIKNALQHTIYLANCNNHSAPGWYNLHIQNLFLKVRS